MIRAQHAVEYLARAKHQSFDIYFDRSVAADSDTKVLNVNNNNNNNK